MYISYHYRYYFLFPLYIFYPKIDFCSPFHGMYNVYRIQAKQKCCGRVDHQTTQKHSFQKVSSLTPATELHQTFRLPCIAQCRAEHYGILCA